MMKKLAAKIHSFILRRKWNMSGQGANLLGGVLRQDYKKHKGQLVKVYSIHKQGFSWDDWHVNNLTRNSCREYLRTAQYYAMHPLNEQYSQWIDDKLTLKYLCTGTPLERYMPKYYYQIDGNGNVLALPDAPDRKQGLCCADDVVKILESCGELALKRVSGSLGEGFYKAIYKDDGYYLNDKLYSKDAFVEKMHGLKEYLITEYLHPHRELVPFCADTANCIRYLVGRNEKGEMQLIKSFIRLGTKASGFVENYNAGGVLCYISGDGNFEGGNLFDNTSGRNRVIQAHPDTGIELKGHIPLWNEIQNAAEMLGHYFPQMTYLGIDFVVTNKNEAKILEINSLTSLDAIQLDGSILKTPQGEFFRKRLHITE